MNLFKTFTLTWWQAGSFKLGMWASGIAVGAHWHEFFWKLSSYSYSGRRDWFKLRHICVGEAINDSL
jgi:hypothetical protein